MLTFLWTHRIRFTLNLPWCRVFNTRLHGAVCDAATAGVERRKDAEVINETPMAYKDIDAVIAAQSDLVEVVRTLWQAVCVKG